MNTNLKIKETISLLIIDDHKMVREGVKIMLISLRNSVLFKVQEAESGEEALIKIDRFNFDVAIVDYQMPGMSGVETIRRVLRVRPHLKILALSNYDELSYIRSMMDAGAKGFVLKSIEPPEMLKALRTILSNKNYYCNDVSIKIIEAAEDKNTKKVQLEKILSTRETDVLKLIAMEMTNEEIAGRLGYSDAANFRHAFIRWTGKSPSDFRSATRAP